MVDVIRDHDATGEQSGKQVHHVAQYDCVRPVGPNKSVLDVVTEDGAVYRFEQCRPGDPWSYAPGNGSDNRQSRSGRLPGTVEAVISAETPGKPDRGWVY